MLILPTATYRARDFLQAAAKLDLEVVVATDSAPPLPGRFLEIDCSDADSAADAIVAFDRSDPIDAVVAVDDQGVVPAALAAERLGLSHNDPSATKASQDKAAQRRLLQAAEVSQPDWAVLAQGEDTKEAARKMAAAVGFPCVVKPRSLSASRGVIRADDPESLEAAILRSRQIAADAGLGEDASLVVEGYVDGDEVALEGMLHEGRLETLAIFDKPDPLVGPYFEETIYTTPSRMATPRLDRIKRVAEQACRAIGLAEGPVHAELRDDGERSWCIEVASRTIGGHCSRALSFEGTTGDSSLEELVLAHAVGMDLGKKAGEGATGVMMIPAPGSGTLISVQGQQQALATEGITALEISLRPGDLVLAAPENSRYLGFIFASGPDPASVERSLRLAHSKLRFTLH